MEQIRQGFEDLGDAIAQEEANDDQAAQDAVDQATKDIQAEDGRVREPRRGSLGAHTKINDAVAG